LDGKKKTGRRLFVPLGELIARRQTVERIVDLDGSEAAGIVAETSRGGQIRRIEISRPVPVVPTRCADVNNRHGRPFLTIEARLRRRRAENNLRISPVLKGNGGFPLKIAQIAPLFESVPPRLYGGTERVVAYLTDELVRLGHDVTLWASGDSRTLARLQPARSVAMRLDPTCEDAYAAHILMLERFAQHADEYDIAHFHVDCLHFPLVRRLAVPHLTTLHGRLDLPDLEPLYREFREIPVVSISD